MNKKNIHFFIIALALPSLILMGFIDIDMEEKTIPKEKTVEYNLPIDAIAAVNEKEIPIELIFTPITRKGFIGFREAIGFKESQGIYNKVNTLGYLGKYQFGKSTLNRIKIYNPYAFLNDPVLQEKAFITLSSLNKWILQRDIKRSVGKKINGIEITESGILAAAHLAGAGNVKKYLRSNGSQIFTDAYGSNIQHYMRKFAGYDTSCIIAIKNATI